MSQDWTEKYRPDSLSKVVGNPKAVADLTGWANSWNRGIPDKRAVVLIGNPGIGKTSAAVALARDMKWDVVEMNASDQRNGDAIRNIALKGAYFNTFMGDGNYIDTKDGGRKLIILDEADNLFGREDRGALPAISELIKNTRQPVILIMNDFYEMSRKSAAIKTETLQITFQRPRSDTIVKALEKIAKNENVRVDTDALTKIAENSNGDMRAAVRNLESLALGRDVITGDDADKLSDRIIRKDVYDLLKAIFREKDPMKARKMLMDVDETPDHIMLWIDENMPFEFKDKGDLTRGYEKLSRADLFMGRVRRRQYYGFWSYAGDMMSSGVNLAKRTDVKSFERFRFPTYLSKMSRSKSIRSLKAGICSKLSSLLHTSTNRISNDVLPLLKVMLKNDPELMRELVRTADL
ncbi:MAG: replication factor C large subunit, partial [Methanomassiliicoccaceae archaeon]|nr:replication factor C large subunit [Methanomassiliicoccaceae archaeon]